MSVLDRWLDPARRPSAQDFEPRNPATFATSPKNAGSAKPANELDVADPVLHAATPPDVATCSSEVATAKGAETQASRGNVADVAGGPERENRLTQAWRALFEERASRHRCIGRTRAEAERLAWGDLQSRWYIEHGERVPGDLCAGCRLPIGDGKVLNMIDGNRVHFETNACLIRHGDRWRDAATRALEEMGLRAPE
jgi:hypothetical protein